MNNYYWETELPLATNELTMHDFVDNHMNDYCGEDFEVVYWDGTYIEIQNDKGTLYGVSASGNGDFCSHKIEFNEIY